jgi:hypothetical protein
MDKFWSIGVVPIGIILGFGPALLAYWLFDSKGENKGLFDAANPDVAVKPADKNGKRK